MQAKKHEAHMSNEERLAVLETTILNINSTLLDIKHDINHMKDDMNRRFESIDRRFDTIDTKFDKKFDIVHNRLWSNFLWLMGMMIGIAGLIAHTQHWI